MTQKLEFRCRHSLFDTLRYSGVVADNALDIDDERNYGLDFVDLDYDTPLITKTKKPGSKLLQYVVKFKNLTVTYTDDFGITHVQITFHDFIDEGQQLLLLKAIFRLQHENDYDNALSSLQKYIDKNWPLEKQSTKMTDLEFAIFLNKQLESLKIPAHVDHYYRDGIIVINHDGLSFNVEPNSISSVRKAHENLTIIIFGARDLSNEEDVPVKNALLLKVKELCAIQLMLSRLI